MPNKNTYLPTPYLSVSPQGSPPVWLESPTTIDNLDPPTVDYRHEIPIPTTVGQKITYIHLIVTYTYLLGH